MNVLTKTRERSSVLFDSILVLTSQIVGLITAIVNLVRAIVETKKEQKK